MNRLMWIFLVIDYMAATFVIGFFSIIMVMTAQWGGLAFYVPMIVMLGIGWYNLLKGEKIKNES